MFEAELAMQPKEKVVYIVNDKSITYGDLLEKSVFYGELLKKEGTGPVILYGHKSIEMVIMIFACLYAKRAYVPVDLYVPIDRMKQMVASMGCKLIIQVETPDAYETFKFYKEDFSKDNVCSLYVNELEQFACVAEKEIVNDIAYILFTSGSTGNPKGVPITRANLLNFIEWMSNLSPFCNYKECKVLNQGSFSFDISVASLFYPIYNGHTVVSLTKESQEDFNDIFNVIKTNQTNMLVSTPTFIKVCLMNKEFDEEHFDFIKCFYVCGEQLEPQLAKNIYERFPNADIINAYGPTEATSAVSAIKIRKDMLGSKLLPVGKVGEFATEIEIENEEIILKGKSVFSGYIGNQKGGFYTENGLNCFRTGDIGYIENDLLYCKGRKDSQIKYKGYRIELYDIEENFLKISGVEEAIVIPKYQENGIVKLIKAFVVLEDKVTVELVKEKLKKLVPEYMVPKIIKKIDKMPINSNGKIDRKRLSEL